LVTASDLQPLSSSNVILKYADDTYLIIPAYSQSICQLEIQNIEGWTDRNNLKLNRKKSCEIVFLRPRSNRQIQIPPPGVDGFDRVQHVLALGVTLCHNFCMSKHIDTVITSCARTLYGLRILRAHASSLSAANLPNKLQDGKVQDGIEDLSSLHPVVPPNYLDTTRPCNDFHVTARYKLSALLLLLLNALAKLLYAAPAWWGFANSGLVI